MPTAPLDQPSPRPSLNRVLYGSFRSLAVGGFIGLSVVVIAVTGWAGRPLTVATDATMVAQARRNLAEVTRREAEVRNEPFEPINAHAKLLQRDEEAILATPQLHPPPRGAAGRIQISQETRDLLGDRFKTEARGRIELKGRGLTATWWLIAERQDSDAHGGRGAQQV